MRGSQDWAGLVTQLAAPGQTDWVALEHGDESITIKELADAMTRAAGALAAAGSGVVAVSDPNPINHTIAVLGACAAARPAMLVDAKHPDSLLADVVDRADATTVVGREVPGVTHLRADELLAGEPAPLTPRRPDAPGSIFLTSGSTGLPKLVQRSRGADLHAAMCLRLANFPIDPGDRHWLCVPFAGAPFLTLLMGSLLARATVVIAPFDRKGVDAFLAEKRISSAYLVPTMLRLAREHAGLEGPGWQGLRGLLTGGEKLDEPTAQVLLEHFGSRVFCAYGMTEIPRLTEATFEEMRDRPGTVGRTTPLRQVRICEVGGERNLPPGEEGEVLATGPDLFDGYLGEPPAGEWYRTGDLGRMDEDGFLYITGRASTVVQVGGNRVSTEEVAATLRRHPAVADATVIALEDPMWTNRLEAFVVLTAGGAQAGEEELRAWTGEQLPAYKVPRTVHLLDELPSDSSGKRSTQALLAMARERAQA